MSDWPRIPPAFGTTLPSGPVHRQEFFWLVDGAVNGIVWHMIYEGVTLNKWLFLGGAPMQSVVEASESRATASYGDMTTVGPSLTAPAAGVYDIGFGAGLSKSTNSTTGLIAPDIAGAGAVDADAMFISNTSSSTAGFTIGGMAREALRKTIGSPFTVVLKYKPSDSTNATYSRRWLRLVPVRIDPT